MKLTSFNITNFKSISQSGKCYLADDITIFAGKNESGKSNLLKALYKLTEPNFKDDDFPANLDDNDISIEYHFNLTKSEFNEIKASINNKLHSTDNNLSLIAIVSSNSANNGIRGRLIDEIDNLLFADLNDNCINTIKTAKAYLKEIEEDGFSEDVDIDDVFERQASTSQFFAFLITELNKLITLAIDDNHSAGIQNIINKVTAVYDSLEQAKMTQKQYTDKLKSYLPEIIYFDSFNDLLPSSIEISEIEQSDSVKIINDFCTITDLDVDELNEEEDTQKRSRMVKKASTVCMDEFKNYWKQDKINLQAEIDGSKLLFHVYNDGKDDPFKPEQRSKGFQWYLSFFLTLKAHSLNRNSIILIDEPGLYLHAKAQNDVLNVLESLSKEHQIIFTTHSPFLIDPDRLDRVRLVVKNSKDDTTSLVNKIHKGADVDTLTPIISAIGLDISKDITLCANLNIIVEGISDYYYLKLIMNKFEESDLYSFPTNTAIIPCVGHTKIPTIVSLLIGWGAEYKCLFDKKGTNKSITALLRSGVSESDIVYVGTKKDDSIEDLFQHDDFIKFVLNGAKVDGASNTEIMKNYAAKNNKGKEIVSKLFFNNYNNNLQNLTLCKKTMLNFKALFDEIFKK